MSLDASLPSDATTTLDEYAGILRDTREEINTLSAALAAIAGGEVALGNDLILTSGATQIVEGSNDDLGDIAIELVNITGTGACSIGEIVNGREGQIKIFMFGDSNITFVNGADIVLNRTGNMTGASGQYIALINIGGDPSISENGIWKEILSSKILIDDGVMVTTAGKALLDDANAAAQLVTLGLTATAANINAQTASLVASGITQVDFTKTHAQINSGCVVFASWNTNLASVLATIGSTKTKLIVDCAITLTVNTTIPANVELDITLGGSIISAGYTLTINGPMVSSITDKFSGFAVGNVTFGKNTVDCVYTEWWGATASLSKITAVDCMTALKSAIATGKHVKLLDGYYGVIPTDANGAKLAYDGQKLIGSGIRSVDDNGGTYLYKISGIYPVIKMGAFGGQLVEGMTIDGNGLAGNVLALSGTYYSSVNDVFLKGQGGTDYALYALDWNSCSFTNVYVDGDCYAGIKLERTAGAGYSTFTQVIIGSVTANSIYIGNYCNNIQFITPYVETPIVFQGIAENIEFDNLGIETSWDASALIVIPGVTIRNIVFRNVRDYHSAATTYADFDITDARNVVIDGLFVQDLYSAVGKDIIALDGLYGIKISNVQVYTTNILDFISCSGDISYQVFLDNVNYVSGAAATCKWKTSDLTIINSNMNHEWVSGAGNNTVFINVTGNITTANIGLKNTWINSAYAPANIAFTADDATPSVKVGNSFVTANANATTITDFDDGFEGQRIFVLIGDAHTTVDFTTSSLVGNAGADWTPASGDSLVAEYHGTTWYCTIIDSST